MMRAASGSNSVPIGRPVRSSRCCVKAVSPNGRAAGSRSWIYTERKGPKAGIPQETSYWSLPESALDDPEEACAWGLRSLAVARAMKAAKPVRRRRPKSGAPRA